jgi:hypothetical protein
VHLVDEQHGIASGGLVLACRGDGLPDVLDAAEYG